MNYQCSNTFTGISTNCPFFVLKRAIIEFHVINNHIAHRNNLHEHLKIYVIFSVVSLSSAPQRRIYFSNVSRKRRKLKVHLPRINRERDESSIDLSANRKFSRQVAFSARGTRVKSRVKSKLPSSSHPCTGKCAFCLRGTIKSSFPRRRPFLTNYGSGNIYMEK